MLAPTNSNNLAEVYAEFWRIHEIAEKAEPAINSIARSSLDAEIAGEGDWYLVQTYPGSDLRAMRWLARRRFGVFRAMQQRTHAHHEGQAVGGMEPVFPGHLFVYVFGIDTMRSRLSSCPGVSGVFCDPHGRPVPVNQPDQDGVFFIDKLRALAWVYSDRIGHVSHTSERNQRRIKLGRKERKTIDKLKNVLKTIGKFDPSTWADAAKLAPGKRITLLMAAIRGPVVEGGAQAYGA